MKYFSITRVFGKLFFCCTQCVCIRRFLNRRHQKKTYINEPDFNEHPIYDIEVGEL